jgi:RNA polymerase-interacting CarD/CdnL/TRCF family regulator
MFFYPKPLAEVIVEHVKQKDCNSSNTCVVQVNGQRCEIANSNALTRCTRCYERILDCVCNLSSVDESSQQKLSQVEELVISQMTRQVSKVINRAKAKLSNNKPVVSATPAVAASNIVNDNTTENMLLSVQVQQAHREKLNTAPLNFMSSVVKVLKRNDPLRNSPEAKAALMKESSKLVSS